MNLLQRLYIMISPQRFEEFTLRAMRKGYVKASLEFQEESLYSFQNGFNQGYSKARSVRISQFFDELLNKKVRHG